MPPGGSVFFYLLIKKTPLPSSPPSPISPSTPPILVNIAVELGDLEEAEGGSSPFKIRLKTKRGTEIFIYVCFRFGGGPDRFAWLRDVIFGVHKYILFPPSIPGVYKQSFHHY